MELAHAALDYANTLLYRVVVDYANTTMTVGRRQSNT